MNNWDIPRAAKRLDTMPRPTGLASVSKIRATATTRVPERVL